MIRKRLIVVIGMLAVLAGAGLVGIMTIPPQPGVTKANFNRIHKGQAKADVEELLGGPAKDQRSIEGLGSVRVVARWGLFDDGHLITVEFDAEDKVVAKDWLAFVEMDASFFQQLRHCLRL